MIDARTSNHRDCSSEAATGNRSQSAIDQQLSCHDLSIREKMMTENQSGPSPVMLALAQWVNGDPVGDEALYRMRQFGFIHPDLNGKLQLTPAEGRH